MLSIMNAEAFHGNGQDIKQKRKKWREMKDWIL